MTNYLRYTHLMVELWITNVPFSFDGDVTHSKMKWLV